MISKREISGLLVRRPDSIFEHKFKMFRRSRCENLAAEF